MSVHGTGGVPIDSLHEWDIKGYSEDEIRQAVAGSPHLSLTTSSIDNVKTIRPGDGWGSYGHYHTEYDTPLVPLFWIKTEQDPRPYENLEYTEYLAEEAARELESRARAAKKTAAVDPAEGDKYALMEPLIQTDKDNLDGMRGLSPAERQKQEWVLKTQRQIQYYFRNPDEHMKSCMVLLPEKPGPEGHPLRKERGLPLREIASWNRVALLSPEEILRIVEKDSYFTINYGQGETYGKLDAITLRLNKQCCSCGLPAGDCVFPGDMRPPGELEKLESYEGQHVAYTLHGHHACCFSEEEEEVDSDGELLFDSETCALADQDPSKYQSS